MENNLELLEHTIEIERKYNSVAKRSLCETASSTNMAGLDWEDIDD